jgi:hypothetical protein
LALPEEVKMGLFFKGVSRKVGGKGRRDFFLKPQLQERDFYPV